MHRLGFDRTDIESVKSVYAMKYIKVCGIFTHLCVSDSLSEDDICFTRGQIQDFYELIEKMKKAGLVIPQVHVQSSYGLLNYPEIKCDYVRVGISLYGVSSSLRDKTILQLDLKPVLSLKTRIALLRRISKGESVGYGRAFVAKRDSIIATLPIGYADGYPRCLSCGNGYVLIAGQKAPIVGKICMDQLMVDVTDISNVETGMTVTMIGNDGNEELTVEILAEKSGSITNELLSRMGKRLKIVVKKKND